MIVWVVVGLATLWVPSSRNPYVLAVLVLAYIAGLFVVIQLVQPAQFGMLGVVFIAAPYAVAAVLIALSLLREAAIRRTREIGVDTTAEVISAAVTAVVNYVTRQRFTLRGILVDGSGPTLFGGRR